MSDPKEVFIVFRSTLAKEGWDTDVVAVFDNKEASTQCALGESPYCKGAWVADDQLRARGIASWSVADYWGDEQVYIEKHTLGVAARKKQ